MKSELLPLSSLAFPLFKKEGRRKYSEPPEDWLEGSTATIQFCKPSNPLLAETRNSLRPSLLKLHPLLKEQHFQAYDQ